MSLVALALAVGLHWLDVEGVEAPGWVRHVQVIDTTWALDGPAEGWTQHAVRLTEGEALDLAAELDRWAGGQTLPDPPMIWTHTEAVPGMLFRIDLVALPGMSPQAEVRVTALAYIEDGEFYPGSTAAQVHTRQEMVVTRAEAATLAAALADWIAGNDPDDEIWQKVVEVP